MDSKVDPQINELQIQLTDVVAKMVRRFDELAGHTVTKKSIMDMITRMISTTVSVMSSEPNDEPYPPMVVDMNRAMATGQGVDLQRIKRIAAAANKTPAALLAEAVARGLLSLENELGQSN